MNMWNTSSWLSLICPHHPISVAVTCSPHETAGGAQQTLVGHVGLTQDPTQPCGGTTGADSRCAFFRCHLKTNWEMARPDLGMSGRIYLLYFETTNGWTCLMLSFLNPGFFLGRGGLLDSLAGPRLKDSVHEPFTFRVLDLSWVVQA